METRLDPTRWQDEYLTHVQDTQSPNTYEGKKTTISKFVTYCEQENVVIDLDDQYSTVDAVYGFFEDEWLQPISTYLSHIRTYFKYIGDQYDTETYYRVQDLTDKLTNERLPDWEKSQGQYDPEWLDDEEIEAAMTAGTEFEELVVRILFETGCRRGEVAAWKPSDVNWDPGGGLGAAVTVERTVQKTGVVKLSPKTDLGYRVVELTLETAEMLQDYIEENDVDADGYIFKKNDNKLYRRCKSAFQKAGIKLTEDGKTKVAPHWLRHARNTRLRKNSNISEADREQYIGNDMPKHYTEVDHEEVQGVLTK